jgi:hypothetical protein
MEIIISATVLAALLSGLFLFSVHRLNRNHTSIENRMSRSHTESLESLKASMSKESHAANHLYTRKAVCFEEASKIVGDLIYWGEKCVVPTTVYDFGSKKDIATRMLKAFEDLRHYTLQHSVFFDEVPELQKNLADLMASVNHIQNMIDSDEFRAGKPAWNEAVGVYRQGLAPVAKSLKTEIYQLMKDGS